MYKQVADSVWQENFNHVGPLPSTMLASYMLCFLFELFDHAHNAPSQPNYRIAYLSIG